MSTPVTYASEGEASDRCLSRMTRLILGSVLLAITFALPGPSVGKTPMPLKSPSAKTGWRALQPGVHYAAFPFPNPTGIGDSRLHVVRIDPRRARFHAGLSSEKGGGPRTAAEWCRREKLAVAINMGMYATDGRTNVGYLRSRGHVNNGRWNSYRSVLCLSPRGAEDPPALWIDRDGSRAKDPRSDRYDIVTQNLRLIRFPGRNVWSASLEMWSEAAVAADASGRILFLFARSPLSMKEFNRALLQLPLGVVQAMHVEGGPEASMSIHAGGVNLDLCGSFETSFRPDDSNAAQWPIPNVLGVALQR